ncbi:MAG: lipopolysaccharide heptosyltransferase II [Cyanobacteriota bacterium]
MNKALINPKKILIMRYRYIGDTTLTVPFIRNLRARYPEAQIDIMVGAVDGEVLKHCPYIDNLIIFDKSYETLDENFIVPTKQTFWGYVKYLRTQKYDLGFILKRSFSSAMLAFLGGVKYRIGFNTEFRFFMLNKSVTYDTLKHEVDCFLDLLRAVNIEIKNEYLEAWTSEADKVRVDELLSDYKITSDRKVMIVASSTNPNKMWSDKSFADTIEELTNNFNCQIFFIGTKSDEAIYNRIKSKITVDLNHSIISIFGKTSVLESLEIIKRMSLVIGIDSGMMHMAASVNIPTISIFGPMNDLKWAPLSDNNHIVKADVACRPCSLTKDCTNNLVCLTNISYRDVISVAAKYLNNKVSV